MLHDLGVSATALTRYITHTPYGTAQPPRATCTAARLAFIAPAHNQLAHAAAATYNRQLTDLAVAPPPFVPITPARSTALAAAGLPDDARALHRRYADWWLLDGELELAMGDAPTSDIAPVSPSPTDAPFIANSAMRKRLQRARPATRTRTAA